MKGNRRITLHFLLYNKDVTNEGIQRGFDTNQIVSKLDGISNGLCSSSYENARLINQAESATAAGFASTSAGIADLGYRTQNCCCETNRNIDAVRYENSKNTCDITTAIHAEGEATRALINQNTIQELRDRLENRDRDLLTANFQLSQQAQSAALIGTLRPFPQPAYITCSPYQTATATVGCNGLAGCCA